MDTDKLLRVVERTASYGLSHPDRAKWMLIWACDICGELSEFIASRELVEAGDVLWGCGAVSLITGVPLPFACHPVTPITDMGILCTALGLLDHLKKVARDGLEYRELDDYLIDMTLSEVLMYLSQHVNLDEAVSAVDIKLLKRYPDGYSPDQSVNRVI